MIENRRVLVTGASRGIGRAVCQRLYEDDYEVIGLSRSKPINWPNEIIHVAVDLSCEESLISTVKQLVSTGSFYGLVNNVGIVSSASLEEVTVEDLQQAVDLNLKAHILCAQAVLKGMRGLGAGRIVNIGSRAGLGKANRTVYSATKMGMIGMSRTWALELAADGITVNVVSPGPIATELFQGVNPDDSEQTRKLIRSIPVGRIGKPEDVANAVAYFMDIRSGYVTGQTHYVCGGMTVAAQV